MRKRDRFNACVNEVEEELLNNRIKSVRKIIKALYKDVHSTRACIEPCEHMLIWGSLMRFLLCIESAVDLVAIGYIGSANALLRQQLEFLMWAKLGIEANEETLVKLNQCFYDESFGKSYPVTYFLKQTNVIPLDSEYSEKELKEKARTIYHKYSFCTHATGIAQQTAYKVEYFTFLLNHGLTELCVLLDSFLIVFGQYCSKLFEIYSNISYYSGMGSLKNEIDKEKLEKQIWAATVHAGEIMPKLKLYHSELIKNQGDIQTVLQPLFEAKWSINNDRIKGV